MNVFIQNPLSAGVPFFIFACCLVFAVIIQYWDLDKYKMPFRSLVFTPLICGMFFFLRDVGVLVSEIYKWAAIKNGEVIFLELITLLPLISISLIYSLILCIVDFAIRLKRKDI